jgi:hypothetical protein
VNFALFLPAAMHTKNQFIQILHGYLTSKEDDARQIQALKEIYPYSQVLHALSARLSKDHDLPSANEDLQQAAVHAADRAVLKEVMTRVVAWPASHEVTGIEHPETPASISTTPAAHDGRHRDTLAEEVMFDLNRLSELRHNFESMFEEDAPPVLADERPASGVADQRYETLQEENEVGKASKPKARVGRKPGREKAQRIIDLARALEKEKLKNQPEAKPVQKKSQDQKKRSNGPDDEIINDIKNSKKKLSPETDKQQEQLEIIEQFINSEPRIPKLGDKAAPSDDLSGVRGGEFGEHLVSETLVEILIHQGKKERAIEVLKKLIWKFPQKKAYFAAQIEDLKR